MRSAVRLPLLFLIFFFSTASAWSQTVRVEAMVGAAVVVFEKIECPDDVYDVPTGEVAVTDPVTCETRVMLSTLPDDVGNLVWAIANNPEAIDDLGDALANLTEGELAMVVTVLQNNQQHLGTTDDTVIEVVSVIAEVAPDAAATVVLTATVLNPEATEEIVAVAIAAAPAREESIREAVDTSGDIREQLGPEDDAPPGGDGAAGDAPPEDDGDIEVVDVEDVETETQPEEDVPPGGSADSGSGDATVPPGGGSIPEDPGPPPSPE